MASPAFADGPSPFFVKNTFIDAPTARPHSLDGFFQEREIRTCPASREVSIEDVGLPLSVQCILESLDSLVGAEGSARSRSTSVGRSSSPRSSVTEAFSPPPPLGFDFSLSDSLSPLYVKNTFISGPTARPHSLDGFFQEREVRSCPASRNVSIDEFCQPPGLETPYNLLEMHTGKLFGSPSSIPLLPATPQIWPATPLAMPPSGMPQFFESFDEGSPFAQVAQQQFINHVMPPPPAAWKLHMEQAIAPPPPHVPPPPSTCRPHIAQLSLPFPPCDLASGHASQDGCAGRSFYGLDDFRVLRLVDALAEEDSSERHDLENAALGSAELPTVGSAGHKSGICRPCAFMYTKGCDIGKECTFCHICPPGERKARSKEKNALRVVHGRCTDPKGCPPRRHS